MLRWHQWSLLKTKQASSRNAIINVGLQGFQVCHLMYRERRYRGERKVRPLFPNYLMVQIDTRRDDWKKLVSTRGVVHLFMSSNLPSRIPDRVIAYFRGLENSLGYVEIEEHETPRFTSGQTVMATSGLFEKKFGTYRALVGSRGDRVKVLFDILGKSAEFEVDAHSLVAA